MYELETNTFYVLLSILGFAIASYFLFTDKKISLLMGAGLVLAFGGSGASLYLWKPYPQVAKILLLFCILPALALFIAAVVKMSKEINRGKGQRN